jgi:selenide, water dikinase
VLSRIPNIRIPELLVGSATSDDAAVLKIDVDRAIVQTVDFFTPIVDDPELFGSIAAANSVSDIYAMGAEPILGLAIAMFPTGVLPLSMLESILVGGAKKAAEAGFPIAGGHTIIGDVPMYGLAVTGIIDTRGIVRNSTARPGDRLYLTKPIGNGILVSAWRALSSTSGSRLRGVVKNAGAPAMDEAIDWMNRLNRDAARAMTATGVSAATDITGYGLMGHLLEMCIGSGAGARIRAEAVPVLKGARSYLEKGFVPAGTLRNAETLRKSVVSSVSENEYRLMCDAQTSGGLLIAVDPEKAQLLEANLTARNVALDFIGEMTDRAATIEIVH